MGTWIVAGVLITVIALIVLHLVRSRKQGKLTCGGNCANCKGCH